MTRLPILSKAQTLILFFALIVPLSAMESFSVVGEIIFAGIATLTFLLLRKTIRPVTAMIIIMNYLSTLNFASIAALNGGNERLIFNALAASVLASGFVLIARDFQLFHKKKAQEQGWVMSETKNNFEEVDANILEVSPEQKKQIFEKLNPFSNPSDSRQFFLLIEEGIGDDTILGDILGLEPSTVPIGIILCYIN